IQNGRENRIFSDRFFETDAIAKTTLIPKRLAIRILREATDTTKTVTHPQDGLFLYVIKTLEGVPIGGSFYLQEASPIPEKNLSPGLSFGVIGMHPGEEREIFIHPDLFYTTSEGNGKPVIVRIVCHGILPSSSTTPSLSLLPIQMKHTPLSITTPKQFSKIQSKIQEWAGWQAWMHYKGSCSLQEVLNLLQTDIPHPTSKTKLDMLLFEWYRYKKLATQ
ncbi:MAG: FKBP-type peptidyl-prolyl cis-trans isomerase, partial [Chlamydiales bacterium]|nr:FKBP-type peptidyl-prolyl cis-trans isomerase [Chlamydiales bacterium]